MPIINKRNHNTRFSHQALSIDNNYSKNLKGTQKQYYESKKDMLIKKCLEDPEGYFNNHHVDLSGHEIIGLNEMVATHQQK